MSRPATNEGNSERELNEAIAEYYRHVELGNDLDRTAFLAKFPGFERELREFLSDVGVMGFEYENAKLGVEPNSCKEIAETTAIHFSSEDTAWSLGRLKEQEFPIDFGDYELLSEIDRGGMGIVFRAKHKSLPRVVALKVMKSGEFASEKDLQRFRTEVEAAATVKHKNIVPIYEIGEARGLIYFTMDYVDGCDLATAARERDLAPREIVRMLIKVTDAVSKAHRLGIIHRDLKPSNILVDASGEPYLIDFGLAKFDTKESNLTGTGQIVGTAAYMPPEQAIGQTKLTPQVDVYSLGAVLYATVTGQPPFSGITSFDILLQVIHREPCSPRKLNRNVNRTLEKLIVRAMAKSPKDRYPTSEALKTDLQRFLMDEPIAWPTLSISERLITWWRREPALVGHLLGIGVTLAIVLVNSDTWWPPIRIGLLVGWMVGAWVFQRFANIQRHREAAHIGWLACDIAVYTLLLGLADPPRGLLLIGYPMMICASAMFYQVRHTVIATLLSMVGFLVLCARVTPDPINSRLDFVEIYLSGLAVLGLCQVSLIHRVRSLTDYYQN